MKKYFFYKTGKLPLATSETLIKPRKMVATTGNLLASKNKKNATN